jgi:hypothetical protein
VPRPRTTSPAAQGEARKEERLAALQYRTDLQRVMSSPEGRRVLARIIASCGVGVASKTPLAYGAEAVDCYETMVRVGERSVGDGIVQAILDADPQGYSKMVIETIEEMVKQREEERDATG